MKNHTKRSILHLLYPNRCPVCGIVIESDGRFCGECEDKLTVYSDSFCISGAESFTAAYVYDEAIKPAIILMKDGTLGNSAFALGNALCDRLRSEGITERTDIIVPVPMYGKDLRERGYDQAVEICRIISENCGIPYVAAVEKYIDTMPQKELNFKERQVNLKGAFRVSEPDTVKGKRILLVDDICTTGSTLAEIVSVLLSSDAAEVHCACCCKTEKKEGII